jgi:4-amino-4-deoxy-L-arabinose transferase-like glycosyltransferase
VALVSLGVFERIPHVEDEAAYWFQAQVFAQGRLSVPTPPLAESYWSPFVIDYQGQRFGKYPPGYPLLLSVGMALGAPWAVNALLGALALWLVADLGRKVYSPVTGLLAAAMGLTCPVMLAISSSLLSHTASIFLAALFLWAFAGVYRSCQASQLSPSGKWAALAGLALGYLAITRPLDAVGIGFPFALYGLGQVLSPHRRSWLRPLGIAAVVAILVGLILPLFWYRVTGQVEFNPYRFVYPYDRPGFGPDVGVQGHSLSVALIYLKFNLGALATSFLGWLAYLNVAFMALPFVLQ